MTILKLEINFSDAVEQQCVEFNSMSYTDVTRFHSDDIENWCFKLLDTMDYDGIVNSICNILYKINSKDLPKKLIDKLSNESNTE